MARATEEMNKNPIVTCPHCGGRSREYTYHFDVLDAVLLIAMDRQVRFRKQKYPLISFTAWNQVHVPDLSDVSLAVRCRTTMCSKLGLIAKLKNARMKQIAGVWVITRRGWDALRGVPVPAEVKVFQKKITERTDRFMTISEAFQVNRQGSLAAADRKSNRVPVDYRAEEQGYKPEEWLDYTDVKGAHKCPRCMMDIFLLSDQREFGHDKDCDNFNLQVA